MFKIIKYIMVYYYKNYSISYCGIDKFLIFLPIIDKIFIIIIQEKSKI